MNRSLTDAIRSIPARYSAAIFLFAAGLFLITVLIEVTIIFQSPNLGDVSNLFRLFIQAVLGLVGLISGAITIYDHLTPDGSTSQGPKDEITIEGNIEGDAHFHLADPEFTRSESTDESTTGESGEEDSREVGDE